MGFTETFRNRILPYWKTYIVILVPLVLLPLITESKEGRTAYVIILMAIYWMTEALPLAVTSLIPVVLFPLLGVMSTGKVCVAYMKETNMMFIGGLMVALSIEYCNLHKRIALRVLMFVGASPRWLMAGFMFTTMFLSMWISNTATTAMMVPIVDAVVQELFKDDDEDGKEATSYGGSVDSLATTQTEMTVSIGDSLDNVASDNAKSGGRQEMIAAGKRLNVTDWQSQREKMRRVRVGVLMSVAYASNVGGTGSLIGSSPQLALKGILFELYGTAPGLNFASWMAFNVPGMLINTFLAWVWLQLLFIGFSKSDTTPAREKEIKQMIRRKYEDLGAMTFHEGAVLVLFIGCVMLWFFRDPQFITGWSELIHSVEVDDATAVLIVVMLLFIIPATPRFWCFRPANERGKETPSQALLQWNYVQDRLPWGIVLLLGGGFAISDASKVSGLSIWLGQQLSGLSVLPPFAIMIIVCIMTATVTEVASNTATANILLPVLAEMALTVKVNPLFLMLPATVTCSYAFMLPVATPPNAIVFSAAKMSPVDMVKAGFLMNIICVIVICIMMQTLGSYMFNIYEIPAWAIPAAVENAMASSFNSTV